MDRARDKVEWRRCQSSQCRWWVDGEVISVIDVQSFKAGDFGDDDKRLLEILGQHVASAFRWLKADSN